MSKDLILMRHADASEAVSGQTDFDRPLSSKGIHDASKAGTYLFHQGIHPGIFISSPAKRAEKTAVLVAQKIRCDLSKIKFNDDIYKASVRILLKLINDFSDSWKVAFMIGHNPPITYLMEYLTGRNIGSIPPGGVLKITFEIESWSEVSERIGELKFFKYPTN